MAYSNRTGYEALIALAEGQGGIERIWFGTTQPQHFAAKDYPLLWLKPLGWEQSEDSDPAEPVRACKFELRICSRPGLDGLSNTSALEDLGDELVEAIQHQALGGAIPALTLLSKAKLESSHQVEQLVIEGSFSYLRDDPSNP